MNTELAPITDTPAPALGEPKITPWTQDLTGQRFERLLVVRFAGHTKSRHAVWECRCDCGATKIIQASQFKRGQTKSCGCMLRQWRIKGIRKTGMRHNDVWRIWRGMIARCTKPARENYHNYGGRGISVCERWMNSFQNFQSDIGPRPSPYHSIDRINVNGNYEPTNCRWATATEQQRNRTCSHIIEFRGDKKTITEWAEELGLTATGLRMRFKNNWDFEEAMTTPAQRKGPVPMRDRPKTEPEAYAVY